MNHSEILRNIVILIGVAVFIVAFLKRLNLSPVLGYFMAGALIGEHGFRIIEHGDTQLAAEFGVVFLLFAIGLELSFERLKAMRKYVFGLGTLQVITTAVIIGCTSMLLSQSSTSALIIGGGLALSSTAIVLQVIAENRSQATQVGRIALAVLLMQDFAVVPLLVVIPLLAGDAYSIASATLNAFLKAVFVLIAIFISGRLFLRPAFNVITSSNTAKNNEVFIAATILIALAAAWATESMGLSLALGAFVAGILVAETEFQVQAEESIAPFKGLLLGLFFMTVGMTIDVMELYNELGKIIGISFGIIVIKATIIAGLCMIFGFSKGIAIHAGLLLSQGSEFAFILFKLGISNDIIDEASGQILLMVVTFTMAFTPLLSLIGKKLASKIENKTDNLPLKILQQEARDLVNHVVIAGFGKVGKMVAKVLQAEYVHYIAIDIDERMVKDEQANGFPVYNGDISQLHTLNAVGLDRAISVVFAIDNEITLKKAIKIISRNFPQVAVVIKAQDLKNSAEFYEIGATIIVPESYEIGLQLGGAVLKTAGIDEYEIVRIKNMLRANNYVIAKNEDEGNA